MMPGIIMAWSMGNGAIDSGYSSPGSLFSLQGNQTELSVHDLLYPCCHKRALNLVDQ